MDYEYEFDILENYVGVSEEAIILLCKINGTNKETFEDILYACTGYRSFDQFMEYEGNME